MLREQQLTFYLSCVLFEFPLQNPENALHYGGDLGFRRLPIIAGSRFTYRGLEEAALGRFRLWRVHLAFKIETTLSHEVAYLLDCIQQGE